LAAGFDPGKSLSPWWRKSDLDLPLDWREGDVRGIVLPGYESLSIQDVPWERLRREPVAGWRQVKKASTRRVVRAERAPAGDPAQPSDVSPEILYYKWVHIVGPMKTLGGAFRESKAAREFHLARRLLASGFLTPTPLLVAERRRGPFLRDAFLVTRGIDPAWVSVHDYWEQLHDAGSEDAYRLIEDVARAVCTFHDRGLFFADSRADHWFTRRDAADRNNHPEGLFRRWAVLDLDASRLGHPPSPRMRRRLLAMLVASFCRRRWTPDHSRRLLDAYGPGLDWMPSARDRILAHALQLRDRNRKPLKQE